MIPSARKKYNASFTDEKYLQFLSGCSERFHKKVEFKICETPVFIPAWLHREIKNAGEEIIDVLCRDDFKALSEKAIPYDQHVPGEEGKSTCLALDFGICKNEAGEILPQLIEMQGFPSLYGWQNELAKNFRKNFPVPDNTNHLFSGLDEESYFGLLNKTFKKDIPAENTILLEVEPEKQKTWIDFYITREITGIEPVSISDIKKEGRDIYYEKDGKKIPVHRIYNRLIFDEFLLRNDLHCEWDLREEVNAEWVCHPNWFFRISKYTMPMLRNRYVPETHFLHTLQAIPDDLQNWVLKPLFSFAGSGVKFDVKREDIESIKEPEHFILQRKVNYEPVIETPDIPAKCEVRMMYIWKENDARPTPVTNLVRLSKGVMIGVNFNKDKTWVGGTVGFFEDDATMEVTHI